MDNRISDELVERMVALVRSMASSYALRNGDHSEACAINALLPEPVDPDLLEAREIVARGHDVWAAESPWHAWEAEKVRAGRADVLFRVADTLAGIKRGRELASPNLGAGSLGGER